MNKNSGDLVEAIFVVEALKQGLKVAHPMFVEVYDVMVDNGSKIFRVQVKGRVVSKDGHVRVRLTTRAKNKQYNKETVDIIAVFISEKKEWVFVPVEDILGKTSLSFRPETHCLVGWDIFKSSL